MDLTASFSVNVEPSEYGKEQGVMDHYNIVISTVVTRYFEPEEFYEQGFMSPFTMSFTEVLAQSD